MPTYLYETVTASDSAAERFEVKQPIGEAPLQHHPVTGVPVRRVISGGLALVTNKGHEADPPSAGCGPENCGCGRYS
jgi:predicted nucleic acid-binding Zn ribbon protein